MLLPTPEVVLTGTWLYDGLVPKIVQIARKPAWMGACRFGDDDQLDQNVPIPVTADGFLYLCWDGATGSGDHLTLEDAKASADRQPWGPIKWDELT